jgi:outer membrane lipoprotein-sorting protein
MLRIMMIACCLAALQVSAQYPGYKPLINSADFRQQFTKTAQATQSIQCDFMQEKNLSMLSDKIVSTGKFWFKRDNKVRMEYEKPSYYLLIINGNNIKTKDGQKENKVSAKSNKMFEQINQMMIDCVQGTALDNKNFTTKVFENAQSYLVELIPTVKNLQGIFKSITLTVDKKDYSVSRMEMLEQSGDNTTINFLHKQMNINISDEVFSVK